MYQSFFALSISVENRLQAELYISLLFSAYYLLALGGFEALQFLSLRNTILQVTHLLRKISLMAKPSFLGQLMKEVILPK